MLSWTLFNRTIQSNYKIVLIFLAVLAMYFTIITGMYDPNADDSMQAMLATLPPEFANAFGFTEAAPGLMGFISTYFYGFLILAFPMLYEIIVANRLIAKQVDNGSMAYLLSTPHTRFSIVFTQAKFLLGSITLLIAFVTVLGYFFCEYMFPGELDVPSFLLINLGALLIHYVLSGIAFFASCFFNDTKNSLAIGAGIPIAFLLIQMISGVSDKLDNLKYATIFTLYNPADIVNDASVAVAPFIILIVTAIILYTAAIITFNKKDLPL